MILSATRYLILQLLSSANFLIVGSHGDQHMLPATFGSTASAIVAKAKCDVLTVTIHPVSVSSVEHTQSSYAVDNV